MEGIKKILERRAAKRNKNIHSEAHYWADFISREFHERKRFAMYLGIIKRIGVKRAQKIFAEVKDSQAKSPGKLFVWKAAKKNMPPLAILTEPNQTLRKKSEAIDLNKRGDKELRDLAGDMVLTMKKAPGVGLAAPQIGKSIRLIVVERAPKPLVLINPKIVSHSLRKDTLEEGCLSVPGKYGLVKRWREVKVRAQNLDGTPFETEAKGLLAQIFQHEIDHLNGVLYTDKVVKNE